MSIHSDLEKAKIKPSKLAYPDEIGVVKYMGGDYDVFPDLADIPPSVKYIRHDAPRGWEPFETMPQKRKVLLKYMKHHTLVITRARLEGTSLFDDIDRHLFSTDAKTTKNRGLAWMEIVE